MNDNDYKLVNELVNKVYTIKYLKILEFHLLQFASDDLTANHLQRKPPVVSGEMKPIKTAK